MAASYKLTHVLITLALLVLCFLMVLFPAETWHASVRGLSIWWDVLFPSLFPFLVLSELLLGFGIVHFLGTLLNPLMRPLFRVPGSGGFVFAVSCASGYPTGAKLTAQLWDQKLVTREEGERLVGFWSLLTMPLRSSLVCSCDSMEGQLAHLLHPLRLQAQL